MALLPLFLSLSIVSASAEPIRLASPGLTGVNLPPDILRFYSDHFAQQLGFHGLRVTTESEIQQLLGFERQRQLLGCANDSSSCLAELANALGVDGLVNGSIGRVGKSYQMNIKIISAQDGTPLAAFSKKVRDEEEVLDSLSSAAENMSEQVFAKLKRVLAKSEKPSAQASSSSTGSNDAQTATPEESVASVRSTSSSPSLRRYSWAPLVGGVAFAGLGVALNRTAWAHAQEVSDHPEHFVDQSAAQAYINQGKFQHTLSLVSFGVAAAGALTAGAMWLGWIGSTPVQVSVVPGSSPSFSVAGNF